MARTATIGTLLVAMVFMSLPRVSSAGNITVESARSTIVNEMVVVDADFAFEFSASALEAIESGVAIFIDIEIRLKRRRKYLWDPKLLTITRRLRIERHVLSDQYIITDMVTEKRRTFGSLEGAVEALGRLREIPIAEQSLLDGAGSYRAGIKAKLDIEALPAPLRPIAYISPSWRMASDWYQWNLTH